MTILNLYQIAFIATIVAVIMIARWSKRQMEEPASAAVACVEPPIVTPTPVKPPPIPVQPAVRAAVTDNLKALNKLFDDNLISVEEYVELRRRVSNG